MSLKQMFCEMEPQKHQDTVLNVKRTSESEELETILMGLNLDKVQRFFVSK